MMSTLSTHPKPVHKESSGGAFYAGRGVTKTPMISRAKGIFIWDTDGKRRLEGSSGAVAANIGHGNERVRDAMIEHIYSRRAASGKFGEWFMAAPPLIITEPEVELFNELLTETLRMFEREVR
ncbi:hypothetical protein NKH75_30890 [Mesorhizobium sp. M0984]|uniref:hypothetical protein n=1 Tax=Mesorhizobium sp. M0984 TaxID=2957041 RepID=UPI00333C0906